MSAEFQSNIDAYSAQVESYKEQLNSYKNELINNQNEKKDMMMQAGLSAVPLVVQGAGVAISNLAGSAAGSAFSQVATPEAIAAAIKGDASILINNMQTLSKAKVLAGINQEGESASNPVLDLMNSLKSANSLEDATTAITSTIKSSLGVATDANASLLDTAQALASKALAGAGTQAESGLAGIVSNGLGKLSGLAGLKTPLTVPTSVEDITDAVSGVIGRASAAPAELLSNLASQGVNLASATNISSILPEGAAAFANLSGTAAEGIIPESLTNVASSFLEPVSNVVATTSNQIARAFQMAKATVQPAIEDGFPAGTNLLPSGAGASETPIVAQMAEQVPETVLSQAGNVAETSFGMAAGAPTDLLASATATAEQTAASLSGLAQGALSNLTSTVTSGLNAAASGAGEGIASATEAVTGAVGEGVAGALAEGATAEAIGAGFGPVGLIVGGLVTLGTVLGSIFGHHETKPVTPVVQTTDSIPVYQSGLSTGN